MEWFTSKGADIYLPLGHSPDADLVVDLDGRLLRVQVKTSGFRRRGRWEVALATRGGNRSWSGVVKLLDRSRCDLLFVAVADGRRWCIPTIELGGGSQIVLGGPRYACFEVERGSTILRS